MLDSVRSDLQALQARVVETHRRRLTLLVGIDGRGGSGKTTLARWLADVVPETTVVEFDDFFRPSGERASRRELGDDEIGGDFDWPRLRHEVLEPLAHDRPARYRRYDWVDDRLAEWREMPPGAS